MALPARAGRSTQVHAAVGSAAGSVASYSAGMNDDDLVPGGFSCDQQAAISLPPREDVVHSDHWRVAHAFNSALPGWLVLLPTRHVASFTELTPEAADELGARTSPWRRTGGCH